MHHVASCRVASCWRAFPPHPYIFDRVQHPGRRDRGSGAIRPEPGDQLVELEGSQPETAQPRELRLQSDVASTWACDPNKQLLRHGSRLNMILLKRCTARNDTVSVTGDVSRTVDRSALSPSGRRTMVTLKVNGQSHPYGSGRMLDYGELAKAARALPTVPTDSLKLKDQAHSAISAKALSQSSTCTTSPPGRRCTASTPSFPA